MKKLALAVSAAALLAVPAAPAAAAGPDIDDIITCGFASCTYPFEQEVEYAKRVAGQVADCATGTVQAYWNAINGYPQGYYCEIG